MANLVDKHIGALRELWDEGYSVVIFNPNEIGDDVSPDDLSSYLIQCGWDYILNNSIQHDEVA